MDVDITLARKLARRLEEELLALAEVEAILGDQPELVEQRETIQRRLALLDRALVAAAQKDEPAGA